MTGKDKKLQEKAETNRRLIRQEFSFPVTEYGYQENFSLTEHDIYSQVLYAKNNWRISITTVSYDRRISLRLVSPQGQSGFLDYYFSTLDKEYERNIESIGELENDINYKSNFLRTNGQLILEANAIKLKEILNDVNIRHNTWIGKNIL